MSITVPKFFKKWDTLFFILLALISYLYSYQTILFLRPCSIHQWRQCDCLSITLNYYKEGMHFFSPSSNTCNPYIPTECPLLYYFVALLWKIFGYHEFIYRLLDVTLAFAGLYSLFKLTKEVLQDGIWALFVSILLFTSPIFAVYANNFIIDIPAISFILIAWYFFVRYYKTKHLRMFYVSILFFMLAGLIKVTDLLSFFPLFIIFIWELFRFKKARKENIFINPLKQGIAIMLPIIAVLSWNSYYLAQTNAAQFDATIHPIWKMDKSAIYATLVKFNANVVSQYFSLSVILLSLILLFIILINFKKRNSFYYWLTLMIFIGTILYILIWFDRFSNHDYYLITFLILIPLILITFLIFLKEHYSPLFQSNILKIATAIILMFNIYYCRIQTNIRYPSTYYQIQNSFLINKQTRDFWEWMHYEHRRRMIAVESVTPYLRNIGISRNDTVISIPDGSPNISLYLMDVKGYTDYAYFKYKDSARIEHFISLGARYLIINDPAMLENIWLKPYLKNKIGTYKNITIYNLRGL